MRVVHTQQRRRLIMKLSLSDFERRNFLVLTFAGIINAIGVTIFLAPVKLYDTGISGTSMLLGQLRPSTFSPSMFLLILNIPLFLYGLKKQGPVFTIYAIYTVIIYSIFAWLIEDVLPINVSIASPLAGTDLLLCSLFGGLITGTASGFSLRFGGAMDGIEVLAVIFSKQLGISVGAFVMVYNVILYTICGFCLQSWILPLYSIVTYMAAIKAIDFIIEGFDRAKCAIIVTDQADDICDALSKEFQTGMTRLAARGGYSGEDKTMIYFILNRFQITTMKNIIRKIDPKAYIVISEVADVFPMNQAQ